MAQLLRSRVVKALTALAVMLVFSSALAATAVPARAASTWTIYMMGNPMEQGNQFLPANLTVDVGDTVTWVCADYQHTTTSLPGQAESWDSGIVQMHQSYSHTFTIPGQYNYTSTVDDQMYGIIVVRQPVPEFPGALVVLGLAAAVISGLGLERWFRRQDPGVRYP